jgi:hypothetical protein
MSVLILHATHEAEVHGRALLTGTVPYSALAHATASWHHATPTKTLLADYSARYARVACSISSLGRKQG